MGEFLLSYVQPARDVALVLLSLELLVVLAIPLAILLYITRFLRSFVPKVAPAIRNAHEHVRRGCDLLARLMSTLRAPFVTVISVSARLRALSRALSRASIRGGER